ncbi:MAG: 23S rRNA (uracil-5-)-methyltransferase RumA, partial [Bacteroidales bacterium]|nr:23S rRNA (uracil-5-)-methyltransferase RumA [Bacteroidales bacterium]
GMHPSVVEQLLNIEAKKIIYISCNPATQARDVNMLMEKYSVNKIQPVDMFPHTQHVENIIELILK